MPAWNVVPCASEVVFDLSHRKGSTFHEDKAWTGFLSDVGQLLEPAVFRVIVCPTGGAGGVSLAGRQ